MTVSDMQDKDQEYSPSQSSTSQFPSITHLNRKTFVHKGQVFLSQPTVAELLVEAGMANLRVFRIIMKELNSLGIDSLSSILQLNKSSLSLLDSVPQDKVNQLYKHLVLVKYGGPLLLSTRHLEELEKDYYYLTFVEEIDRQIFSYSNGRMGLRSQSIIELCGPDGVGKTQWCLTAVCNMLQVGKQVVYIDTEGGFDLGRIKEIAKTNNISKRSIKDNIFLSKLETFDELDEVLEEIETLLETQNVGLIVIDSIMQALQNSYPVTIDNKMDILARRQLHLRKTMRRLRSIARRNNIIVLYSNQTTEGRYQMPVNLLEEIHTLQLDEINRTDEGSIHDELRSLSNLLREVMGRSLLLELPMGGATLAHSSDMRIFLGKLPKNSPSISKVEVFQARVENCAYLPRNSVNYVIESDGINIYVESDKKENAGTLIDLLE